MPNTKRPQTMNSHDVIATIINFILTVQYQVVVTYFVCTVS